MTNVMKTDVAILGAGPAGLLLAQLLHQAGIGAIVVEAQSRDHVLGRVRAGVLEQGTVDTLRDAGIGPRMDAERMEHHGIYIQFADQRHLLDIPSLAAGRTVSVYGQQEVVRDLIALRDTGGPPVLFETRAVAVEGLTGADCVVHLDTPEGVARIECAFVAGCDGFHGLARQLVPGDRLRCFERNYPYAWLGVLVEAPPSSDAVVYAHHPDGFALSSMRSPEVSRLYLQCPADDDIAAWSDAKIWEGLHRRLGGDGRWPVNEGPILQRGITPLRSFVAEPMRHGRLFLAGDAAHIVPPTGAKGMNLAVADVRLLARALERFFAAGNEAGLDDYSDHCLRRVWKVERFSARTTELLHVPPGQSDFDARLQLADLDYLTSSPAAAASFAENYSGLPFD